MRSIEDICDDLMVIAEELKGQKFGKPEDPFDKLIVAYDTLVTSTCLFYKDKLSYNQLDMLFRHLFLGYVPAQKVGKTEIGAHLKTTTDLTIHEWATYIENVEEWIKTTKAQNEANKTKKPKN